MSSKQKRQGVNLVEAKSILIKSGLPGSDWVINPYNGCTFGCMYCYAAQMARWRHPDQEWGTYLDVKINAPQLLKKELIRLEKKLNTKNLGSVFFSSVTDPYVGLETNYQLTRQCLEVLLDFGWKGPIALQTKSPLVTRDIDILQKLKKVSVGLTITTLDDKTSQFLEVNAPPMTFRMSTLKKLNSAGIKTYVFVGPLLPRFLEKKKSLNKLLDRLQSVGVSEVWFEHINLSPPIKARLFTFLEKSAPQLIPAFSQADNQEYRDKLEKTIKSVMCGRGMKMGLGKVIHHSSLPKK